MHYAGIPNSSAVHCGIHNAVFNAEQF